MLIYKIVVVNTKLLCTQIEHLWQNDKSKIKMVIEELDEKKKETLKVTWVKVNKYVCLWRLFLLCYLILYVWTNYLFPPYLYGFNSFKYLNNTYSINIWILFSVTLDLYFLLYYLAQWQS